MEKYLLLKINIRSVSENAYLTLAKNIVVKSWHYIVEEGQLQGGQGGGEGGVELRSRLQ
jgi:hypothetical protein